MHRMIATILDENILSIGSVKFLDRITQKIEELKEELYKYLILKKFCEVKDILKIKILRCKN